MKKLHIILILGLAVMSGCGLFSKKQNAVQQQDLHLSNVILADSFLKEENAKTLACIMSDSAAIYIPDSSKSFIKAGCLYMGDTLSVTNAALRPFMNMYYTLQWHGHNAYVLGTNLGFKTTGIDFDGDGRMDEIICGYPGFDTTSQGESTPLTPMWIRLISATGEKYEVHDSGTSDIMVEEIKDSSVLGFSKPTKILDISSGYPACGYNQYSTLIAFRDGRPAVIRRFITDMDGGYGNFYETILPVKGKNHQDTIYMVQHMNTQLDENSDSIVTMSWDSSLIYLKGDKWITNTYWHSPADSSVTNP